MKSKCFLDILLNAFCRSLRDISLLGLITSATRTLLKIVVSLPIACTNTPKNDRSACVSSASCFVYESLLFPSFFDDFHMIKVVVKKAAMMKSSNRKSIVSVM